MRKLNLLLGTAFLLSFSVSAQEFEKKSIYIQSLKNQDLAKAPKKVYITNFKIYYQMIAEAEKTVYGGRQFGGGSYTGNATARLAVGVEGIGPKDLQALTDKIYSEYVADLEALGLEVYNAKTKSGIPFYEDYTKLEGPRINQEQVPGSLMVIPSGFSYHVKKVTKKGKEKAGGLMGGTPEFVSAMYHKGLPRISRDLDDMMVVDIALSVPSIYLDPKSQLGSAKIKGGPDLKLSGARASYASGKSNKPGAAFPKTAIELLLQKPMKINGVFEAETFKTVATKSRTTVPDYGAFFTVDNKTVELSNTIECDPAVYSAKVGNAINMFLGKSLEKFEASLSGEKLKSGKE
ncbi:MAG: hypothetical protein AAF616_10110 [Bacteroidota bacterium]